VTVHLGEGADVNRAAPVGDRAVERGEVVVALAERDSARRDHLVPTREAARHGEGDHRNWAVVLELYGEPRPPGVALVPAEDHVVDLGVLAGLAGKAARAAENAQHQRPRGRRNEHQGDRGGEQKAAHSR